MSGYGGVGVDYVEEVVDVVGVPLGVELHAMDRYVTARRGVAVLAM